MAPTTSPSKDGGTAGTTDTAKTDGAKAAVNVDVIPSTIRPFRRTEITDLKKTFYNASKAPVIIPTPEGTSFVLHEGDYVTNIPGEDQDFFGGIPGLIRAAEMPKAQKDKLDRIRRVRNHEEPDDYTKMAHGLLGKEPPPQNSVDSVAFADTVAAAKRESDRDNK